jgi:uncharacterized protein
MSIVDEHSSNAIASRSGAPLKFFLLVFALSVPFWLIGAVTGLRILPGLPVSSLGAFCPLMAASILVYRKNKTEGVKELLKKAFDYNRIKAKVWYAPIVLLMPGAMVLTYGLMPLTRAPLPTQQFPVLAAPVMFLAFSIAALGEELGWSGYVIDLMQDRWSALEAGILLGLVWAAWHIVPLAQAHRSPAWIAWWSLFTVASRVLMTMLNPTDKGSTSLASKQYGNKSAASVAQRVCERKEVMNDESKEQLRERLLGDEEARAAISQRAYEIYQQRGGGPGTGRLAASGERNPRCYG